MLVATLNHNLPGLTDNLVKQLEFDNTFKTDWELMVVDNGSSEPLAKTTTHKLAENIFFGGGFNVVLDYFLSTNHEYLYFLNNDLIFHGPRFLQTSLREAKESDAAVYSPAIINAQESQCHWRQMWNWGVGLREVRWIDFQAPLLRRDICEIIREYPEKLILGWGLDFYTGIVCENNNLKTIVSDTNTICHLISQTFRQNKINIGVDEFCRNADFNMYEYFSSSEHREHYLDLRTYGETYAV